MEHTSETQPLRIGIDCRMYSSAFTGIGRYTYELVKNLLAIDKKNHYALFFNDPEFSTFVPPNDRIHKIRVNARHYSFKEQTAFLRALYENKLDLMHFTHFNAPMLYFRPSVVTIHDLTLSFFPGHKMTSPLYRAAYHMTLFSAVKKAKHIIAVSNYTKKDIQKLFHLPDARISVIYEGVDENFGKMTREESQKLLTKLLANKEQYLLYTGVWRSHKNLTGLIKAFHLLKKNGQFDGKLVITGREDPFYPEVRQLTRELQLENEIIFTGLVDEKTLQALYKCAHVYVFPSLYEGFGLPPLEAMQSGVPVVAAKTSSIPEVCGRDNALFFDPCDTVDMATAIHRACTDEKLRKHLIENGLQHVQTFSWEKMATETLEVYNHSTCSSR